MLQKIIMLLASLLLFALPVSAASYKVQKGDTLWKIAQKNNTTTKELVSLNPTLKNPNYLTIAQKLTVSQNKQNTTTTQATSTQQEVVNLVNKERAKVGLAALTMDSALTKVAQAKSQDMKDNSYFSHTSPTYGSPFDMMKQFGISYKSAGENIAKGQTSAQQVVEAWMNSEGHRANILDKKFTHIGVGYVSSGHYWTQMFIKK